LTGADAGLGDAGHGGDGQSEVLRVGRREDHAEPAGLGGGELIDRRHPLRHRRDLAGAWSLAPLLAAEEEEDRAEHDLHPRHAVDAPLSGSSDGPATRSTITLTATMPITQPAANAGPVTRARWVLSMRMTAMIGTGLRATPIAPGRS
jgi:hypothetical protein